MNTDHSLHSACLYRLHQQRLRQAGHRTREAALHHNSHVPTHYTFDHLQCIKLYNYPCGVFACPLLHQHASTPLAWSTCYCTKCRALMYPCMPCWNFYNRPASPVYDMPASYQLACTHCHDTHWRRLSVVVAPEQGSPPKAGFPASY